MRYAVKYTPEFERDFKLLDASVRQRITQKIEWLAQQSTVNLPFVKYLPPELKGLRKCRVGDWRVLLWIEESKKLITLYAVEHRGVIYKRLK